MQPQLSWSAARSSRVHSPPPPLHRERETGVLLLPLLLLNVTLKGVSLPFMPFCLNLQCKWVFTLVLVQSHMQFHKFNCSLAVVCLVPFLTLLKYLFKDDFNQNWKCCQYLLTSMPVDSWRVSTYHFWSCSYSLFDIIQVPRRFLHLLPAVILALCMLTRLAWLLQWIFQPKKKRC